MLDQMLGKAYTSEMDNDYRDFVGLTGDGTAAFIQDWSNRKIIRFDTVTGVPPSTVAVQFPPVGSLGTFSDLHTYLFWSEWLGFASSDGTQFRLQVGIDTYYTLKVGQPAAVVKPHGALSPNGRWGAELTRTPIRTGVSRLSYVVTDLSNGVSRTTVSSEAADTATDPFPNFSVEPSVSNTGRVSVGYWNAPVSGSWPPSIVYIDG